MQSFVLQHNCCFYGETKGAVGPSCWAGMKQTRWPLCHDKRQKTSAGDVSCALVGAARVGQPEQLDQWAPEGRVQTEQNIQAVNLAGSLCALHVSHW